MGAVVKKKVGVWRGDGAVGACDYFLGKRYGKERDHRLNTGERAQVVKALEGGILENFSFGHEAKKQLHVFLG